ncbi:MAG TPA: acetylornithine/succinylornithine family transaminase [Solirubrobacterales bacterium]|nr:acetylornithine/succinylornithine family transaminase [Solirubrobacterales bacterium]
MTRIDDLRDLESRYTMPTYLRAGVEFVRGDGARLWDSEGKEYLDFFAGLSVHNAGHCHPRIVAAIQTQAALFGGSSNLYLSEPALRLAERISESSLGGKVFLSNSGAEAAECAIKLARKHAHGRGVDAPEVVSLDGGFHGRTLGALAATPKLADEGRFGPLPRGFVPVPRDNPDAMRDAVGPNTAAVMIEPIQGEAGIFPVSDEVLAAAREVCDETGALLVLDEVQAGMGRTGSLWAYEQLTVQPDLMTAAKALGGGLPVGAVVTSPELGETFEPGDHGTTFGGGPVAASAALAALEVIGDAELLENVRGRGEQLMAGLAAIDGVAEVRGRGLMVGLTLDDGLDAAVARDRCLEAGLVLNCPGPGMLRLLPPLIVSGTDVDAGLGIIESAIPGA